MKSIAIGLSVLMVLAAPVFAQQPATQKASTEVVWEGSITGIGGWGAAAMANKAREALSKVDGVESVVVDTTARAIFRTTKNQMPKEKALKKALEGMHMKVRKLQKRKLQVAAAVYQVKIKGVGWQGSCTNVRRMFEKMSNVIAAYPFGDRATIEVHVKKADKFTKKDVENALKKHKRFTLVAFEKKGQDEVRGNWSAT